MFADDIKCINLLLPRGLNMDNYPQRLVYREFKKTFGSLDFLKPEGGMRRIGYKKLY